MQPQPKTESDDRGPEEAGGATQADLSGARPLPTTKQDREPVSSGNDGIYVALIALGLIVLVTFLEYLRMASRLG